MVGRSLFLAGLLVLAGCTTPLAPVAPTAVPEDAPGSSMGTATDTRSTAPPTATTTPVETVAPGQNHWGSEPVVIGLRNEGSRDRDFAAMVREAARFWEANDETYLGFAVHYEVRPDAEDPDLVVKFTDRVPDCGGVNDAAGCAPYLTDPRQIDRPEPVWVKTELSDESSTLVLKHELGHTLGLDHNDSPKEVMQARSVLYTEPQPDATDRAFPWPDGAFTVRIDAANASEPADARTQVDHALTYYEDGAPGMPDNLSFERTDAADAEIRIRFGATDSCSGAGGSCVSTYGPDPDGDGAIESYSRVRITLVELDTDAVGWHVGYWLAHVFGAEPDDEKPPPFRDASYRERRSAWWE